MCCEAPLRLCVLKINCLPTKYTVTAITAEIPNCSRALSDSDSKVSRSLQSSLRGFARFSGIAPGEKYPKRICEHYRIELWNRQLRNILPEFPQKESTEPLIPRSFSKHATKLIIEIKPMQSTRLSIPIIKNIVTTLYLQPRGDAYAFYLLLQFLQ